MATKRLTNIPKNKVGEVVQSFIDNDDAEKVTAEDSKNNQWTVEAELPD